MTGSSPHLIDGGKDQVVREKRKCQRGGLSGTQKKQVFRNHTAQEESAQNLQRLALAERILCVPWTGFEFRFAVLRDSPSYLKLLLGQTQREIVGPNYHKR